MGWRTRILKAMRQEAKEAIKLSDNPLELPPDLAALARVKHERAKAKKKAYNKAHPERNHKKNK